MTDNLRKRIAHAIHRYDNHHALSGNDIPSKHHYGEADFVLAELRTEMDALAALRAVARGYCPACGRGDAAPTVADWEQQRDRAQQLAGVLDEVLRHFTHKGHPGEPCLQTGWISEATVARWRAVCYPPALDRDAPEPAAGPAATQATDN